MSPDREFTPDALNRILDELTNVVSRAAAEVLRACAGALETRTKADRSPVTAADMASEAVILAGVGRLLPGIPIVSEESIASAPPRLGRNFVLVDPVDGTRELVEGRDEYTINVAMVAGGVPVLGIVCAPAQGLLWRAAQGGNAERMRLQPGAPASAASERRIIRPRPLPDTGMIAAISRSHLDPQTKAFVERLPGVRTVASGSAAKFCHVAEGAADIYPRLSPTHEWDIAAGHAVLAVAGGSVTRPDGGPLVYGGDGGTLLIPGFIAWGDPAAAQKIGL